MFEDRVEEVHLRMGSEDHRVPSHTHGVTTSIVECASMNYRSCWISLHANCQIWQNELTLGVSGSSPLEFGPAARMMEGYRKRTPLYSDVLEFFPSPDTDLHRVGGQCPCRGVWTMECHSAEGVLLEYWGLSATRSPVLLTLAIVAQLDSAAHTHQPYTFTASLWSICTLNFKFAKTSTRLYHFAWKGLSVIFNSTHGTMVL